MSIKIKKLVALFTSLVLVFSFFTVDALSVNIKQFNIKEKQYYEGSETNETENLQNYEYYSISDADKLRQLLFDGFYNCQPTIDISELGFLATQENADKICEFIYYEMPEAFHITIEKIWSKGNILSEFEFSYSCTAVEYQKMYTEFETVAQNMTKDLINSKLTDVQKALVLHDRLAIICEYDLEFSENCYNIYGALVNGEAVCQGYAEAYFYLLEKVGIKNILCPSAEMGHVWNIVYIDGKAYHVDVTWDDPTPADGWQKPWDFVRHTNFLLSTYALHNNMENGEDVGCHESEDFDHEPTDETYDHYFWRDCTHETLLIGGGLYHLNEDKELCEYDSHTALAKAGLGDIDGDEVINAIDITHCRRFLTEKEIPQEKEFIACDLTKDGEISVSDLVRYKKLLMYM